MKETLRTAAVNWKLKKLTSEDEFFDRLGRSLLDAHAQGVELIVFPEFVSVELISLYKVAPPDPEYPALLAPHYPKIESFLKTQSDELGLCIVGGTHFRNDGSGIKNTCPILRSGLDPLGQDKTQLIPFELSPWNIHAGAMSATTLSNPPVAVQICYEVEFPSLSADLASKGALALCVPSHTDTIRGFNRVRWCCHARTVELQIFAVHSCLIGSLPEYSLQGYGKAAILCPCDKLISDTGVLASTVLNQEGLAIADLDFSVLETVREEGEVQNWKDTRKMDKSRM